MSDGNGTPLPGAAPPVVWVKVEMQGASVQCSGNAPAPVLCNLLKEGLIAIARQMERQEKATLVKPISPLHRL